MKYYTEKLYHVYITMNKNNTVIYVGVTGNVERRIGQHKFNKIKGFTRRYNVNKLVYYESLGYINDAIKREKEIKGWRRSKKLDLIKKLNPELKDLSEGWNIREIPDSRK